MVKYSIIIPVYNTEKYLKQCLSSILAYRGDEIEVIALDDGSTDKSLAVLQSYSDTRLKVIHQENMGLFRTWKKGALLSEGEFILFVDSDDYINTAALETIFQTVETQDVDLIQTDWSEFDEAASKHCSPAFLQPGVLRGEQLETALEQNVFCKERDYISFPVMRWGKVFRAQLLKRILPDLMDNITQYEDISATIPFLSQVRSLCYLPVDFYRYRQRAGSMSKSYEKLPQYFGDCRRINKFFREKKQIFGFSEHFLDCFYLYYYLDITSQAILAKQYTLAKTVLSDAHLCRLIAKKKGIKFFLFRHRMFFLYRLCVKLKKLLRK